VKKFKVVVNGEAFEVEVEDLSSGQPALAVQTSATPAPPPAASQPVAAAPEPKPEPKPEPAAPAAPKAAPAGAGTVIAPMPGNVWKILVNVGDQVKEGDALLILEAMKMENEIAAPCAGTVKEIPVQEGQAVSKDAVLVVIG